MNPGREPRPIDRRELSAEKVISGKVGTNFRKQRLVPVENTAY